MKVARDKLVFSALCVIDEAIESCRHEAITPSLGVRFALSFLWAVGHGEERRSFHDLLRHMQDKQEGAFGVEGKTIRFTHANSCMWAIKRHVGYPLTPEADAALSKVRDRANG